MKSNLVSNFKRPHVIRENSPLDDAALISVVPSIFAEQPHESRSDRYAYISTKALLDALRREGFMPFMASQANVRNANRLGFAKHMLRFRHASQKDTDGTANEVILLNSHDGTSSYQMLAGCYRFVCHNGIVIGETFQAIRIRHQGNCVDQVIEGAYAVLNRFDEVNQSRQLMQDTALNEADKRALAQSALLVRYPETDEFSRPSIEQVLRPRRYDDTADDLWTTFNVIQEHLVKGGLRWFNGKSRKFVTSRAINGIDGNIALNKALWTLAETVEQLKAA